MAAIYFPDDLNSYVDGLCKFTTDKKIRSKNS